MQKKNWAPVVYMSVLLGKEQECEERLGYSDKAENASRSIYNPLASGGLDRPPAPMAVHHRQTDLHTKKRVKKGILFSQTEILFIWNHSFGSQIRLRMHL